MKTSYPLGSSPLVILMKTSYPRGSSSLVILLILPILLMVSLTRHSRKRMLSPMMLNTQPIYLIYLGGLKCLDLTCWTTLALQVLNRPYHIAPQVFCKGLIPQYHFPLWMHVKVALLYSVVQACAYFLSLAYTAMWTAIYLFL